MSPIPLGILAAQFDAPIVGGGTFDLLETQVLASSAASVVFDNLDTLAAGYQHLQVRLVMVPSAGDKILYYYVNGLVGGTNRYRKHGLEGNGSSVSSYDGLASPTYLDLGYISTGSTNPHAAVLDVLDPFVTTKNTTFRSLSGNTQSGGSRITLNSALFNSTDALTSITFLQNSGNLAIGSRFSIYGLKTGA